MLFSSRCVLRIAGTGGGTEAPNNICVVVKAASIAVISLFGLAAVIYYNSIMDDDRKGNNRFSQEN